MNFSRLQRLVLALVASLPLLASLSSAAGPGKPIRLRTGEIPPAPAPATITLESNRSKQPLNGLYLVQLHSAIQPDWEAELKSLGVDVLRYVPEDTYICRLQQASADVLTRLPYVSRFAPFKPEHKMHPRSAVSARQSPDAELSVALLVAPRSSPSEVAAARRSFNRVRQESPTRSGTVIRGRLTAGRLQALAQSDVVLWIEPDAGVKLFDEVSSALVAGTAEPGVLLTQSLGYDGSGVTVSVADSGLHNGEASSMHPDLAGRTPAFFHYGQLADGADEHSHGTHVAGIIGGNAATGEKDDNGALYGLGVAPGVNIISQRIFDGIGNYEAPPSSEKLTRDATRAGADIGSNSWGDDTQGRYDLSAMEFDGLVRDADSLLAGDQQYILEFSAGNAGPGMQTIGSPAVGKNVIATGAAQSDRVDFIMYGDGPDAMADFSSRGPCEDGRIKPDIVAPGTWIASLQSASATDQYAWGTISANYQYQGGTSQAGPHASGAAAVFVQYYRETITNANPSPALVKAALINSAFDLDDAFGTSPVPNNDEGWGAIDLVELIAASKQYEFIDQTKLLTTAATYERRILVDSAEHPLKITLAYTDVPGFPGAIPSLVNDLDLEVVGPDGSLFLGNVFSNGESIPNAGAPDRINNIEGIHLALPLSGQYLIRIRARNVAEDARLDTPFNDQDFALVISASIASPGTGVITFDRASYRAPDTIKLTLVDDDLTAQPTATVSLFSSSEALPEAVLLRRSTANVFTGAVATVTGTPAPDGSLQVKHGDVIEARYADASPAALRSYFASADLQPPTISTVLVTNRFSRAEVRFNTDEPARSVILFGATPSLGQIVTNSSFKQAHAVPFDTLLPGTTNFFKIVAIDRAGNATTNSNNGALFVVVAPRAPAILLVDGFYGDSWFEPPPSLDIYTAPLASLGLEYDIWEIAAEPEPITSQDLAPYQVVIWRVPEFMSRSPFTPGEMQAIGTYLAGGGSFFLASMEATSRLRDHGGAAFLKDVLHVSAFIEDPGVFEVSGVQDDPYGQDLHLLLDSSEFLGVLYGFIGEATDTITPGTGAVGFLTDVGSGGYVGLRYPRAGSEDPGRVIFLPFAMESVTDPAARTALFERAIMFLAPGLKGEGAITMDRAAYTVPSLLSVELADSDLSTQPEATLKFFSEAAAGGTNLQLQATPRQGVFSGKIALVANYSPGSTPQLKVRHGEVVRVEYFDVSVNAVVSAQVTIKTNAPLILSLEAEPGYVDAVIYWETSEPTDASVQFGDSALLGRSATRESPEVFHEITLTQLRPNHTYYYKVVSRDVAGNVTVDDNNGQLYTFRTLVPLVPPWADNLEQGGTNWTVYTPPESEASWELGVPDPQLGPASSPVNAWGTNLRLQSVSATESYLISPAIEITGGNRATLQFSQAYDFLPLFEFDIFNGGEVMVIPADAAAPVTLASYAEDQMDWHSVELDLTPFIGKVVYIAWHHFLFAFDPWPRQGWLIDDVSIITTQVQPGTIVVSNNLWQAQFALSGPSGASGRGTYTVYTNARPGNYTIEYAQLPFYQTPSPQTRSLQSGGTITFTGNYLLLDANTNGISDEWETRFFGNTSSYRSADTDSDGDGMTDYLEFLAGTDPNNPPRPFELLTGKTGNSLTLQWSSAPGQQYRLMTSSNAVAWQPFGSWIEATASVSQANIPLGQGTQPAFFRIQAGATNSPPGIPPNLNVRIYSAANQVQVVWSAVAGRAYQVLSSSDNQTFTPITPWIPAAPPTMTNSVPVAQGAPPLFYRVDVRP